MPYSAKLIAYSFIKIGIDECEPITQMKVQKLVFFANGCHLAAYNSPLINEEIQAWEFGPVVPELYQLLKFYGTKPISTTMLMEEDNFENELAKIDPEAMKLINYTWDALKNISALKLSNWTHLEGSPWQLTFKRGQNKVIERDIIMNYFKSMLFPQNE